ncbi:hypothetical protein LX16_0797 [Stackebrandtia albiflava]|uniref:WD40 repeat protein n=1 Tax=Stackebrandtia albiflava TaxID=406432 RepID=A0A562VB28_9ACTN|nr:hypothetical protein [Stackebrandtia albiflava]TWJ15099.1 hypothetical protein LX16_0797 [Stackebrandtia albiflava]
MTDEFRELLHRRADGVKSAPLAEPAMTAGRRLGYVRDSVAGVAAVAVAAGLVGGYLVLDPATGGAPTAEDGAVLPAVPTDAVAGEIGRWTALPETLVYGNNGLGSDQAASLVTGDTYETLPLPYFTDDDGGDVEHTPWFVSPNGMNVASATEEGLSIGRLDAEADTLVHESATLCGLINWSPDSSRVVVSDCAGDTVDLILVDAVSGAVNRLATDLPVEGEDSDWVTAIWNADGSRLIWGNTPLGFTIADADGSDPEPFDAGVLPNAAEILDQHTIDTKLLPGEAENPRTRITAVSADGNLVCHDVTYGDPTGYHAMDRVSGHIEPGCNYLLDVSTGQRIEFPEVDGEGYTKIVGLSAFGEVITRTLTDPADSGPGYGTVYRTDLWNAEGEKIDSLVEPQYYEDGGKGRVMLNVLWGYTS